MHLTTAYPLCIIVYMYTKETKKHLKGCRKYRFV